MVRTKWHRVAEAIRAGRSGVYTGNGRFSSSLADWGSSTEEVLTWWNSTTDLPKFVVEHELITLASENRDFHLSLRDMQRAGVLRLPFPQIVVEYNVRADDPATNLVLLIDTKDEQTRALIASKNEHVLNKVDELKLPFMAFPIVMGHASGMDIVGFSPACCLCGMHTEAGDGDPLLISARYSNPLFDMDRETMISAMELTKKEVQTWSALAFMSVTLLMITEGVEKERCSVGNLNRKRVASGKAPIPDYTYLKIGRVYRSAKGEDSAAYDARRSPRPHWRRGHLRGVRHGPGREFTRTVFIKPRLVALRSDANTDPTPPTYVAGV